MKDKWFERGGFLYDITKEYGRLRKFEDDIIHNPSNYKDHLNCYEDDLLCNLSDEGKEYITCRFPSSDDDNNIDDFHTRFTWHKKNDLKKILEENNKKPDELISFVNTNFIYKLPDDWDTDRLLRYSFLWPEKHDYWPETEMLRYSIYEITKNYHVYNDWEPTIKIESSKQKWLLAKSDITLTTDIVQSANPSIFNHKKIGSKETFGMNYLYANEECRLKMAKKFSSEENACFTVMYTIGNIIPAGASYKPGGGAAKDTFYDKLTVIKNAIYLPKVERKNKISKDDKPKLTNDKINDKRKIENDEAAILLLDRLGYFKPEDAKKNQKIWNDFIKDHYLQDFVERENDNYTDPIKTDNPADLAKRIIQRGYRIYYQYERDNDGNIKYKDGQPKINSKLFNNNYSFTDYSKGYLAAIFESVGIPDDNLNLI